MQISMEKTESMVIAKEPVSTQYMYLGFEITNSKNLQQEVRAQINKATRISSYLRDLTWRNEYTSAESKVRIYKTAVRPVLAYTAETRADRDSGSGDEDAEDY
ncbi:hypothetical protein Trydic_g1911 [Trypoxylus dichotomus]